MNFWMVIDIDKTKLVIGPELRHFEILSKFPVLQYSNDDIKMMIFKLEKNINRKYFLLVNIYHHSWNHQNWINYNFGFDFLKYLPHFASQLIEINQKITVSAIQKVSDFKQFKKNLFFKKIFIKIGAVLEDFRQKCFIDSTNVVLLRIDFSELSIAVHITVVEPVQWLKISFKQDQNFRNWTLT